MSGQKTVGDDIIRALGRTVCQLSDKDRWIEFHFAKSGALKNKYVARVCDLFDDAAVYAGDSPEEALVNMLATEGVTVKEALRNTRRRTRRPLKIVGKP